MGERKMRFRPCIDIHNGRVKQIVGGTLSDQGDRAAENFVSDSTAASFAEKFKADGLAGGHVILLNPASSPMYAATKEAALSALAAYPKGLQVGGGIRPENAASFLSAGASHVIVTSYVFFDGRISFGNLRKLQVEVGKEHLVLDLSCKKVGEKSGNPPKIGQEAKPTEDKDAKRVGVGECAGGDGFQYRIATDRWQKCTEEPLTADLLRALSDECAEFLVHAVDVEGKRAGIDEALVRLLAEGSRIPVTYAGGVSSYEDVEKIRVFGAGHVDFTVGSALDIYGGKLSYKEIISMCE